MTMPPSECPRHDGRLGLGDRLPGCVDIGVEIAETVPGLAATGQRHRDARDSVACERFGHLAPPPGRVADARAVHEDQRRQGVSSTGRCHDPHYRPTSQMSVSAVREAGTLRTTLALAGPPLRAIS